MTEFMSDSVPRMCRRLSLQVLEAAKSPLSPKCQQPATPVLAMLQDHTAVALTSFFPISLTL